MTAVEIQEYYTAAALPYSLFLLLHDVTDRRAKNKQTCESNKSADNTNLGLVDDPSLSPEGVAVVLVRGRGEHGHVHAESGGLEGRRRSRYAAADHQQVGVESRAATAADDASAHTHAHTTGKPTVQNTAAVFSSRARGTLWSYVSTSLLVKEKERAIDLADNVQHFII